MFVPGDGVNDDGVAGAIERRRRGRRHRRLGRRLGRGRSVLEPGGWLARGNSSPHLASGRPALHRDPPALHRAAPPCIGAAPGRAAPEGAASPAGGPTEGTVVEGALSAGTVVDSVLGRPRESMPTVPVAPEPVVVGGGVPSDGAPDVPEPIPGVARRGHPWRVAGGLRPGEVGAPRPGVVGVPRPGVDAGVPLRGSTWSSPARGPAQAVRGRLPVAPAPWDRSLSKRLRRRHHRVRSSRLARSRSPRASCHRRSRLSLGRTRLLLRPGGRLLGQPNGMPGKAMGCPGKPAVFSGPSARCSGRQHVARAASALLGQAARCSGTRNGLLGQTNVLSGKPGRRSATSLGQSRPAFASRGLRAGVPAPAGARTDRLSAGHGRVASARARAAAGLFGSKRGGSVGFLT